MDDIARLKGDTIDEMTKRFEKRQAASRLQIGAGRAHKLKALVWWAQDQARIGRVPRVSQYSDRETFLRELTVATVREEARLVSGDTARRLASIDMIPKLGNVVAD